ncbi:MAG: hypothetical protein V2A34_02605 [Lentisphaerota bacterium]
MSFTPSQQSKFRPLVARAWLVHCALEGTAPNNKASREQWYREELSKAGGWFTTKECNHVHDYDTCMLHFAMIAGDEYWINRIAHSDQRRQFYLINLRLDDLSRLEGHVYDWNYARAIYRHMHLPERMHDCPAEILWKLFQALDTHVRRIRDRGPPGKPVLHSSQSDAGSAIGNRYSEIQEEIPF